jgi:hypothetical protein
VHQRAEELVKLLRLQPHPEGGRFSEIFRSTRRVRSLAPGAGAADRSALTTIYYLLVAGEVSRLHRLDADETWHHYEGEALDLFVLDGPVRVLTKMRLGPAGPGSAPVKVVPALSWMAARPQGAYSLVGCTMGPGYDAAGFTLMSKAPDVAAETARRFPEIAELI